MKYQNDYDSIFAEPQVQVEEFYDDTSSSSHIVPTIELTCSQELQVEEALDVVPIGHDYRISKSRDITAVANLVASTTTNANMNRRASDIDVESWWGASTHALWSTDEHKRAEFLSATFVKKSAGDSLGLELGNTTPHIRSIHKKSPTSFSPLRVGDRIVSVNKKDCSMMDSSFIMQLLDALEGNVTIVVHNKYGSPDIIESMVSKSSLDEVCGLGMSKKDESSYVHVSSIRPARIFDDSLLNVEDRLISVNGVTCTDLRTIDVVTIIRQAPVYVTVVVKRPRRCAAAVVLSEISEGGLTEEQSQHDEKGHETPKKAKKKVGCRVRHFLRQLLSVPVSPA